MVGIMAADSIYQTCLQYIRARYQMGQLTPAAQRVMWEIVKLEL